MSTFNGWNIISMPASPAPDAIEWQMEDVVGTNRSPFSLQQQIYDWGAAILRASLSFPLMANATAQAWIAFLMAAQGIANIFSFGDPVNTGPQNPSASAGSVTGSGQTGFSLVTSSSGLTPGDWISLGLRLYRVTSVAGGALGIWPNIRESPADGTNLVITNASGLFRLAKNTRSVHMDKHRNHKIVFEIEEAI